MQTAFSLPPSDKTGVLSLGGYCVILVANGNNRRKRMGAAERIRDLKKEKNAVILAHYYVDKEIQDIADYVGDSFYLSKVATKVDADCIVFCGVAFMGESAKILNPNKRVFMPDITADCPMAHMATPEEIAKVRADYDDVAVVCYINSTAELKANADVCVTSSNAVNIVRKLPNKNIFFIPDRNLGAFVEKQVPEKHFIFNQGCCPRHVEISEEMVIAAKDKHPEAKFAAHPECTADVLAHADYIGSTSGIIDYVVETDAESFLIGTVDGVFAEIEKLAPGKVLYTVKPEQICADMKKVTLENVLEVLEKETNEVFVDANLMQASMRPLERMLELG